MICITGKFFGRRLRQLPEFCEERARCQLFLTPSALLTTRADKAFSAISRLILKELFFLQSGINHIFLIVIYIIAGYYKFVKGCW